MLTRSVRCKPNTPDPLAQARTAAIACYLARGADTTLTAAESIWV